MDIKRNKIKEDEINKTDSDCVVIRCEQLTKRYPGNFLAVDSLDLLVSCGEIFGLLGPNGAGKTTMVGMLTSLIIPSSGKAFVSNIDVIKHPALVKQVIGMVAQTNNLDRALTVWENLYYHGRYFGMTDKESRSAANESLVKFKLTEKAKAEVTAISGGMAKRLMVARALLHRPSIIFLDEPTAGLDPQSRIALWEILNSLHSEGQTIFLTTHYMEEADSLCDRLAIMDQGKILAIDTPKNLKKMVGADSVITISAKGDLNQLSKILMEGIEGATESYDFDGAVKLHVKGVSGVLPRVVEIAESNGFIVTDLSVTEPTLENVFINLTGRELRD
jgi:ABC-2 type transport system ATP-binding protein